MNPLSKFFLQTYTTAAATASAKLTSKVRRQAYQMGWPTAVSRRLIVDFKNGQYVVQYPSDLKESVLDLEYGNQTTPPLPALRTFVRSIKDTTMRQEVEKQLKKARLQF